MIRLQKGDIALVVAIVAHGMRDLLDENDDADAGEHAGDHGGREKIGDDPGFNESHDGLKDTGQDQSQQKSFETKILYGGHHDDRKTCGRTTDAQGGAAHQGDQNPPHDAGNQPGEQRRPGCHRDAQAKRNGHQEHHHAGGKIIAECRQNSRVGAVLRSRLVC